MSKDKLYHNCVWEVFHNNGPETYSDGLFGTEEKAESFIKKNHDRIHPACVKPKYIIEKRKVN